MNVHPIHGRHAVLANRALATTGPGFWDSQTPHATHGWHPYPAAPNMLCVFEAVKPEGAQGTALTCYANFTFLAETIALVWFLQAGNFKDPCEGSGAQAGAGWMDRTWKLSKSNCKSLCKALFRLSAQEILGP